MAKALKCDRCGGYFVPKELGDALFCRFNNPILQNGRDACVGKITQRLFTENAGEDRTIDLCQKCTIDFFIFLNYPTRDENMEDNG